MPKTTQTLPAFNPADLASPEGILNFLKKQIFSELYVAMPAVIVAFDRESNRAKVQPAIYALSNNDEQIAFPELHNIPVHTPGGGGFAASFPLEAGNTGWLMICDRDISLFKQSLTLVPPNTYRRHQPEDAFFVPDVLQKIKISPEDISSAVWQKIDGSIKITLSPESVNILGNTNIVGNLNVTGSISSTEDISAAGDVMAGPISLKNHVHSGVQNGQGVTGGPQ